MKWTPLTLDFRQRYDGGYRYLDVCGALMLAAEKTLDLVPLEGKPTGARLELPEAGISVTLDTEDLRVVQESPADDGTLFLKICVGLSDLVQTHFAPSGIVYNGFVRRFYSPVALAEDALAATLRFGSDEHQTGLGRAVGMVPSHRQLHYSFMSGSRELTVVVAAMTFERVSTHRHEALPRASAKQKALAARRNVRADRPGWPSGHAVNLNVDLVEYEPPVGSLEGHYRQLVQCAEVVRRELDNG